MSITVTNTSDEDVTVDATAMFNDPAIVATVTPQVAPYQQVLLLKLWLR